MRQRSSKCVKTRELADLHPWLRGLVIARHGSVASVHASWRLVLTASYVIVNLVLVAQAIRLGPWTLDWQTYTALAGAENPYQLDVSIPFVWSPVMVRW